MSPTTAALMENPPLALYIHFPWCARKCPYCDFNSHAAPADWNEAAYVAALLDDLDADLGRLAEQGGRDRPLVSFFLGGGTPSLFSGEAIAGLLAGIRHRIHWVDDVEVTLEANPGSADAANFRAYRQAGVNRLSLGIQSFDDRCLRAMGRIHDGAAARLSVARARAAGFDNLNLDLMFGPLGEVDGVLFEGLALVLGIGIVDLLAAANLIDGLFDAALAGPGTAQQIAQLAEILHGCQHEKLRGHIGILASLCKAVGLVQ
ncbi:hypothetical protein CCP4SC76_4430002 [Gammaproteobacteria bacterium]